MRSVEAGSKTHGRRQWRLRFIGGIPLVADRAVPAFASRSKPHFGVMLGEAFGAIAFSGLVMNQAPGCFVRGVSRLALFFTKQKPEVEGVCQ